MLSACVCPLRLQLPGYWIFPPNVIKFPEPSFDKLPRIVFSLALNSLRRTSERTTIFDYNVDSASIYEMISVEMA